MAFDASLRDFLARLTPELRETAVFGPELYANMSNCVANGDTSTFSPRLRMWLANHHIRLGSNRFHLLLIPRDPFFQIDAMEEEKLRADYVTRVDGKGKNMIPSPAKDTMEHDLNALEWTKAFERIPVQTQIFDVLVYAHRAHGNSSSMLFEAKRIGMVRISSHSFYSRYFDSITGLHYVSHGRNLRSSMSFVQLTTKICGLYWCNQT
jgi:hypothetical protein